jgi:hypothetical protein
VEKVFIQLQKDASNTSKIDNYEKFSFFIISKL